jgi:hypothetical protein
MTLPSLFRTKETCDGVSIFVVLHVLVKNFRNSQTELAFLLSLW